MNTSTIKSSKIILGLVLGTVVGQFLFDPTWSSSLAANDHESAGWLSFFSFVGFDIFLASLKMLILPLISCSVIVAVSGVSDLTRLGRLGIWTFVYYISTMLVAVLLGIVLVSFFQPGQAIDSSMLPLAGTVELSETAQAKAGGGVLGVFQNLLTLLIPSNVFESLAKGHTLSVITFSLFFGVCLTISGESCKPVVRFFRGSLEALMKMINIVMLLAPLGVFCMLAWAVARIGLGVFFEAIGAYMATVSLGLALHALVTLPLVVWIFAKTNPYKYLLAMRPAIFTAIGTDSSIATLPVTIECANSVEGVSEEVSGLVLPLGANLNMDGTALYEAVAVIFLTQAYGMTLSLPQLIVVAFTATLAAIGAAGIPSAGLVTMLIVIEAVNDSLASADPTAMLLPLSATALVVGVDRILDMLRTAVNVWGDAVGALVIGKRFGS